MKFLKLAALAMTLAMALAPAAKAAPITYNLTLTQLTGNAGNGTGQLTVDGPMGPGFQSFNTGTGLLSLSFSIGGRTMDLSDAWFGGTSVDFFNGNLAGLQYAGFENFFLTSFFSCNVFSTIYYNYTDLAGRSPIGGTGIITAALAG